MKLYALFIFANNICHCKPLLPWIKDPQRKISFYILIQLLSIATSLLGFIYQFFLGISCLTLSYFYKKEAQKFSGDKTYVISTGKAKGLSLAFGIMGTGLILLSFLPE